MDIQKNAEALFLSGKTGTNLAVCRNVLQHEIFHEEGRGGRRIRVGALFPLLLTENFVLSGYRERENDKGGLAFVREADDGGLTCIPITDRREQEYALCVFRVWYGCEFPRKLLQKISETNLITNYQAARAYVAGLERYGQENQASAEEEVLELYRQECTKIEECTLQSLRRLMERYPGLTRETALRKLFAENGGLAREHDRKVRLADFLSTYGCDQEQTNG